MVEISGNTSRSNDLNTRDRSEAIAAQVRALFTAVGDSGQASESLSICGSNSRHLFTSDTASAEISLQDHRGVIDYQPDELTLRARAGTPVAELEALLARHGQCFAAELPWPAESSTLGGAIACGWDGPARSFGLSLRDSVLGCRIVNGQGQVVNFGGQVMKNVAGYDLARLQVGALGTLGVILDVTLRLQPLREHSMSLSFSTAVEELPAWWQRTRHLRPLLSGTCFMDGRLHLRLSGRAAAINATRAQLGGDASDLDWCALKNMSQPFFHGERLACVYLPRLTPLPRVHGEILLEWEGARLWVRNGDHAQLAREATALGGFVRVLRGPAVPTRLNAPSWHRAIRAALDPAGLFNRALFQAHFGGEERAASCR